MSVSGVGSGGWRPRFGRRGGREYLSGCLCLWCYEGLYAGGGCRKLLSERWGSEGGVVVVVMVVAGWWGLW